MKNFLLLAIAFPNIIMATENCTDPFASTPTAFNLVSPFYCGPVDHYKYWISADHQLPATNAPYIEPTCIQNSKAIDLYQGTIAQAGSTYPRMVFYSNPAVGTSWGTQPVATACDGATQFTVTRDTVQVGNESYNVQSTSNSVQIADQSNAVLASAIKSLIPTTNSQCASSVWTVQNAGGLPGAVMAFVLSFRDNTNCACPVAASPTPAPAINGPIITMVVGVSAVVAAVVSLAAYRCYKTHRLPHDVSEAKNLAQKDTD